MTLCLRSLLVLTLPLLALFSATANAQHPSITSVAINVKAPLENGSKVSYGGNDIWIDYTLDSRGFR